MPYSIMFGPDKCGNTYKVRVICQIGRLVNRVLTCLYFGVCLPWYGNVNFYYLYTYILPIEGSDILCGYVILDICIYNTEFYIFIIVACVEILGYLLRYQLLSLGIDKVLKPVILRNPMIYYVMLL